MTLPQPSGSQIGLANYANIPKSITAICTFFQESWISQIYSNNIIILQNSYKKSL